MFAFLPVPCIRKYKTESRRTFCCASLHLVRIRPSMCIFKMSCLFNAIVGDTSVFDNMRSVLITRLVNRHLHQYIHGEGLMFWQEGIEESFVQNKHSFLCSSSNETINCRIHHTEKELHKIICICQNLIFCLTLRHRKHSLQSIKLSSSFDYMRKKICQVDCSRVNF